MAVILTLVLASLALFSAANAGQCANALPCSLQCRSLCTIDARFSSRTTDSNRPHRLSLQATAARSSDPAVESMPELIARVTAVAEQKFTKATHRLRPDQYPIATLPDGSWETVAAGHWMSGFFSGVCWQLYELAGKKKIWADHAKRWQEGLANKQRDFAAQHDFGEWDLGCVEV